MNSWLAYKQVDQQTETQNLKIVEQAKSKAEIVLTKINISVTPKMG